MDKLPKYKNPPINEVVFGVQFDKINKFQAPHTGLFWDQLGQDEFPVYETRPPINHVVEKFDNQISQSYNIQTFNTPPLPRILYINKINNNLIQLQEDRFLRNWRKTEKDAEYPNFDKLFPEFKETLSVFKKFLKENNLGKMNIDQYELSYINHITLDTIDKSIGNIEKLLPDYKCQQKFLPEPEKFEFRKVFRLPENKGRLHILIKPILKDNYNFLIMDLTARGFDSAENIDEWFELSHKWIVKAFEETIDTKVQNDFFGKIND